MHRQCRNPASRSIPVSAHQTKRRWELRGRSRPVAQAKCERPIIRFMRIPVDWSDCPIVEVVPGKVSGVPILKGTRVQADSIVENYETGSPVEEIAYNFDLKPEDIRAVLPYAARQRARLRSP